MPVGITLPSCSSTVRLNAAESKSDGVELEVQARLTENFQLDFSVSYGEATLTEDAVNIGVKGDNLPGSADYNISVGMEYGFILAGYETFIRGDYAYIGEYYHNVAETGEASGGYGQLNLKTGISVNAFNIDLFVNNLTNQDDFTWVESVLEAFGSSRAYRLQPRTAGLNVSYQF
jgi:outer membrane receptor protein involved in Fe transport